MNERIYYGIEYVYGSHTLGNGGRCNRIATFRTMAERNEWVTRGAAYIGSGERAKLTARSPEAIRYRWRIAHGMDE